MSTKLKKIALVTGANRGIGFAIAEGLARENIKVLLGSRDFAQGEKAAHELNNKGLDVLPVELNLANKTAVDKTLENVIKNYNVDILINNAGVLENGNAFDVADEIFDYSMLVNFRMPLHLIRVLAPGMIKRGFGRIVNVSSEWGAFSEGLTGPAAYSISKAALNAITLNVSKDLPPNVKINSMCPGWVRTRMGGTEAPRSPAEGADTAIWLATLPDTGPNGGFFRDKQLISW